jgi:hypothetical protein
MATNVSTTTLGKIFAAHFGYHAEYRDGDKWVKTRVDGDLLNKVMAGTVCRLILKPIYAIKAEEVLFLEQLYSKLIAKEYQTVKEEYTEDEKKALREHFLDGNISELPYPVADYLRRSGYHIPIYGLNLFQAGIARHYTP